LSCLTFPQFLLPGVLVAGTTGKLTGKVYGPEQKPVLAATIVIIGTRLGAYSEADGTYNILNIPAGTYEVSASRLGYETVRIQNIIISADQTTFLDIEMGETTLTTEEVVVTAERPPVDLNQTSTKATVTTEEIEQLPVQDLDDVVNLQAGVVDGHFRGGRIGEVQYQVDGVSVNNAFDNTSIVNVDRSLLQEVQVISGTFDAEYGQAMSGVVNAVLKSGTPTFQWSGEVYGGGFAFDSDTRLTSNKANPGGIQSYQLSLSGPLTTDTVFLVNGRYLDFEDYVFGRKVFQPTSSSDFEIGVYDSTGSGEQVPLGFSREWSGVVKLTNNSINNLQLNYQALVNQNEGRRPNYAYRFNPDGMSQQKLFSISHGLDLTYTLSQSSFIDLALRQNRLQYDDYVYEDLSDTLYDAAGPPRNDANYERGTAIIQGVDFTRFRQWTNTYLFKGSLTSQVSPAHLVKIGGELNLPEVQFGTRGHLTFATVDGEEQLVRHEDEPPDFPGLRTYHPVTGAAYIQDQMEWSDLLVRAGLRLDYLDARATIPSDLANPANAIAGAPESTPQNTTVKASLSPRLGVAYPIEDKAAIHFAYGHFYQFPSISQMFSNADYDVLYNLQAGGISYGVLGNPDVKPEQTVQYEIGYKHALNPELGIDFTTFYKDVRNLLGVEFIETYNGAEYARLTNVDFGNIFGITVALDHRSIGPFGVALDYTWQKATGNSSDPRETATRAAAGEDPPPRLIPFNWDQTHTFNMTIAMAKPASYSFSAVVKVVSGQPYTPQLDTGFGQGLNTNSGRKPMGNLVDLRGEKILISRQVELGLFARVFNLFDSRFFNGMVFPSTGSPFYSRFPEADYGALQDPTRFFQPRRIEVGLRIGLGSP
jgi:outer membrane receptor protein involved in Fe transport